jgi:4'-phosphopantetheinyl transferase
MLARNEVHIWRAPLETSATDLAPIRELLSSDERARADRFVFGRDRSAFIVARGFLRVILSLYLDRSPGEVRFIYGGYGKPSLVDSACNGGNLNFNLSHSGKLAIYGITLQRAVGVDLEKISSEFSGEAISRRFFSANEAIRLLSVPRSERRQAFFDCWTRKEAFIKAIGAGLSLPLDQFDVTLSPGEPAALLETRWDKNEARRWSLRAINVAPGYAASIAVEGHAWHVKYWEASERMFQ